MAGQMDVYNEAHLREDSVDCPNRLLHPHVGVGAVGGIGARCVAPRRRLSVRVRLRLRLRLRVRLRVRVRERVCVCVRERERANSKG